MIFWFLIVSVSYLWSLHTEQSYFFKLARQRGEMVFEIVIATRQWSAHHGGVYVPVTKDSPPNPYLKVKEKNIETPSKRRLTLINPAYMTRQISEIMADRSLNIHLTSLNPLNPNNEPDHWEQKALQAFEKGSTSHIEITKDKGIEEFNYMAPLYTQKGCLACHAEQGYRLGDVRGGLRVTFPFDDVRTDHPLYKKQILFIHILAFLFVNLLTYIFLKRTNTLINRLKLERSRRDKIIEEKTQALEKLATTDALTGIKNRRALDIYLEEEVLRAKRYNESFSYILIDLDHFKKVNDNYGHNIGDLVLKSVAAIIKDHIRQVDFLARYGGEEFAIIMPNTDKDEAYKVTERIRKIIENTYIQAENHQIEITISFGVTDFISSENIFEVADNALYVAKTEGRNRGVVYRKNPL